ncbi:MAG: RHS repeat-associated core domain-containing protein [Spirochaetales bacterium]|nr:RHS repeat-associated core domain-containing protein [Spirochaetales bacterium]
MRKYDEVENKLVKVSEYQYNTNGYRVMKKNRIEESTEYTYDLEGKVLEETTGIETINYAYLGSKHLARITDDDTLYYGIDHLGSTVLLTDNTGEEVWSGAVTPFADQENTKGLDESVKYTGKDLDEDSGLYYFNARWYDPETGRFITEDPARDGVSWYVYCGNNPLGFVDPTGLESYPIDLILLPIKTLFNSGRHFTETPDREANFGKKSGASVHFDSRITEGNLNIGAEGSLAEGDMFLVGEDNRGEERAQFGTSLSGKAFAVNGEVQAGIENYSMGATAEANLSKAQINFNFKIKGHNFHVQTEGFVGFGIGFSIGKISGGKFGLGLGLGFEVGYDGSDQAINNSEKEPVIPFDSK